MGASEIIQKRVLEALPRRHRIEIKTDFKGSFPPAMPIKYLYFLFSVWWASLGMKVRELQMDTEE